MRNIPPERVARLIENAAACEERIEPKVNAFGRDYARRINSLPSTLRKPNFAPGMGISLPNEEKVTKFVVLAAQITDNDTRGNSGKSHQGGEAAGVVLTETEPPMKKEFIEISLLVRTR